MSKLKEDWPQRRSAGSHQFDPPLYSSLTCSRMQGMLHHGYKRWRPKCAPCMRMWPTDTLLTWLSGATRWTSCVTFKDAAEFRDIAVIPDSKIRVWRDISGLLSQLLHCMSTFQSWSTGRVYDKTLMFTKMKGMVTLCCFVMQVVIQGNFSMTTQIISGVWYFL